jgi:hypothetical protein
MPVISDYVLDNGLTVIDTQANRIDICSSEPTTYAAATGAASVGNKTSLGASDLTLGAGSPNGRAITVAAVTGGAVTSSATATHYAIVDTVNSRLLVTGDVNPDQVVTNGNTWAFASSFTIRIPNQ